MDAGLFCAVCRRYRVGLRGSDWRTVPADAGHPKSRLPHTDVARGRGLRTGALGNCIGAVAAGYDVADVSLPPQFDTIEEPFRVISNYEGKQALAGEFRDHMDKMNAWMGNGKIDLVETEYADAVAAANVARTALGNLYDDYPVLLTPSTAGEAPADLISVTMSSFNRMWTLMHGPTMTLPASTGPNGMPVGVQIAARVGDDAALIGWWPASLTLFEARNALFRSLVCRYSNSIVLAI